MPTTQTFRLLLAAALLCGWSSCCTPPAEDYIQQPYVQQQMSGLANAFLALLPPDQASLPAAGAEARWLADTAVVQSAAIARDNRTVLFGWLNNILVNSNLRDRGAVLAGPAGFVPGPAPPPREVFPHRADDSRPRNGQGAQLRVCQCRGEGIAGLHCSGCLEELRASGDADPEGPGRRQMG